MISDYLHSISYTSAKKDKQLANYISTDQGKILESELVLIGLGNTHETYLQETRKILGALFHKQIRIRITDAGNIIPGLSFMDTMTALDDLLSAFQDSNARVLLIAEDSQLAQMAWEKMLRFHFRESTFTGNVTEEISTLLMDMHSQNRKGNYFNLAAFQNYLNDPDLLEVNEALGGELLRLGLLRDRPDVMETALRRSHSCFFHTNAIKSSEWQAANHQPNGLSAAEACKIFHYMGFSTSLKWSVVAPFENNENSAALMAQLIWHYIDGANNSRQENPAAGGNDFLKFYVEQEKENHHFVFYQSKFTHRWWLQVDHPHKESENTKGVIVPCTEYDYQKAVNGESPDAWWLVNKRY